MSCVTLLVDGLEGGFGFRIRLCIHQEAVLVCLHLLRRAADYDEASAAVGAYPLETQVAEGSAYIRKQSL